MQDFEHEPTSMGDESNCPLVLGKIECWRKRQTTEDEMVGWHHQLNGHESEQTLRVNFLWHYPSWGLK